MPCQPWLQQLLRNGQGAGDEQMLHPRAGKRRENGGMVARRLRWGAFMHSPTGVCHDQTRPDHIGHDLTDT